MPKYTVRCGGNHLTEVSVTYTEFDEAGGVFKCAKCNKPAGVYLGDPDTAAVSIFNGPGFTRRSTYPEANRNIDHSDWRMTESWPGPPDKRPFKRPKVTNWTADDFRKGAV